MRSADHLVSGCHFHLSDSAKHGKVVIALILTWAAAYKLLTYMYTLDDFLEIKGGAICMRFYTGSRRDQEEGGGAGPSS